MNLKRIILAAAIGLQLATGAAAQTVYSTPYIGDRVIYVDTVADMLALPAGKSLNGQVVVTKRYSTSHTVGDGSGNAYRSDTSEGGTPDGGFIINDTGTHWHAVDKSVANPLQWGLVLDGSDESTEFAALLAALPATCREVRIPAGYTLGLQTSGVTIPSDVDLRGGGTVIQLDNALAAHVLLSLTGGSTVENITFDGDSASQTNADETLQQLLRSTGTGNRIVGCKFTDAAGSAISAVSVDEIAITNCRFSEWVDHAIYFSTAVGTVEIAACDFSSTTGSGTCIKLRNAAGRASITGCTGAVNSYFVDVQFTSAATASLSGLSVTGNVIACESSPLLFTGDATSEAAGYFARNVSVTGNSFSKRVTAASPEPMHIFRPIQSGYVGCKGVVISGNTFVDAAFMDMRGSSTASLDDVTFSDNIVRNENCASTTTLFSVGYSSRTRILRNTFDFTGLSGTYVVFSFPEADIDFSDNRVTTTRTWFWDIDDETDGTYNICRNTISTLGRRLFQQHVSGTASVWVDGNNIDHSASYPWFYDRAAHASNANMRFGTNTLRGVIIGPGADYETLTASAPTLRADVQSVIDSSSNAVNGTLGSGEYVGQTKTIVMTNASNSSTVSVTNHVTSDPEVFTFDAVDEYLVLMWSGTEWVTIAGDATT